MPEPLGSFDYTWPFYLAAFLGYLIGSIPFGWLLVKLSGQGDIRNVGSGNIGATNVLRTGKKGLAVATLIFDGGKGALAIILAMDYGPDITVLVAGSSIIGHCFPVWLKFKGGKGVATGLGILLALSPLLGLGAMFTWLIFAVLFRYSSLAALAAFLFSIVLAFFIIDQQHAELAGFMAILIILRHHQNIRRLIKGQESKISFSKP
jgi:glycerol-3-phosphate acyltransferase PlsY